MGEPTTGNDVPSRRSIALPSDTDEEDEEEERTSGHTDTNHGDDEESTTTVKLLALCSSTLLNCGATTKTRALPV